MPSDALTFAGDEAGDTSFSFDRGATRYFIIALIGTSQPDTLREALRRLRRQCNLPSHYEFSFHGTTSAPLRAALWEMMPQLDFCIWAIVADKKRLPDAFLAMQSRALYVFFATEAIRLIPEPEREGGTLLLDEFDRAGKMLAEVKRTLKLRNIRRGFRKIRACRSHSEDLYRSLIWRLGQYCDAMPGEVIEHIGHLSPRYRCYLSFGNKTPLTSSDSVI